MDVMGQSQAFFNLPCDTAEGNRVAEHWVPQTRLTKAVPAKEPEDPGAEEAIIGVLGSSWNENI